MSINVWVNLAFVVIACNAAVAQPCQVSWSAMGSGMSVPVQVGITPFVAAITTFDSGIGPQIYAGGHFAKCGATTVNSIARWNGSGWQSVGGGISGGSATEILDFAVYDAGTGPVLYAAGLFEFAGGVAAKNIAKWNGTNWSALGSNNGPNGTISALAVFDNGTGPALYVGGAFTTAGGNPVFNIARWDGSQWSAVGGFVNNTVQAITVFDDGLGGGPALYIGGSFNLAGGITVNRVAKLIGNVWQPLGTGVTTSAGFVSSFENVAPGTSIPPGLYVSGNFSHVGGIDSAFVARWNGMTWSAVPTGMNNTVFQIGINQPAALPNGGLSEARLYAAGSFTTAGGAPITYVAQWDGTTWSALNSGVSSGTAEAISVLDDGTGNAIYFGGKFVNASGLLVNKIARWGYPVNSTPIDISIQPVAWTVELGDPVSFDITVAGSIPTFQWRRNGIDLQDGGSISGVNTDSLTISPAMLNDTGDYDVLVTNICGSIISESAHLQVLTCHGDVAPRFGDAVIGIDDLMLVVNKWGECGRIDCVADLSPIGGDGTVNVDDLMFIILSWGQCK